MRIQVDPSAANDPNAHAWLDRILYKVEDGWHVWETNTASEVTDLEASTWISGRGQQGEWVQELLVQSVRKSAWGSGPHERLVLVTAYPNSSDELLPETGARFAEEPMIILVENRNSDGVFLERVVAELDKPLNRVWQRRGNPIRLDSVGGVGEMEAEVQKQIEKYPFRPRLAVVVDSDRKGPDDTGSRAGGRLKRKCEALGVPCWMLAKRESENYLPWPLLVRRRNVGDEHRQALEAWDRLSDIQKDFFDMKDGLAEAPTEVEQELFDGVARADKESLTRGFGPNVYKCWKIWGVQVQSELRARGRGDLELGMSLIKSEV